MKKKVEIKYNVTINFVKCRSEEETKEREDKIIDILVENAIKMAKRREQTRDDRKDIA